MTEVTVTDYETVEKQETKYKCDHCGVVVPADDTVTVGLYDSSRINSATRYETKHLCDDCTDVRKALQVREQRATVRDRWQWLGEKVSASIPWVMNTGFGLFTAATVWVAGQATTEGKGAIIISELFLSGVMVVCLLLCYTGVVIIASEP